MSSASGPQRAPVGGRAWVFGDDIDTDALAPGQYAIAPLEEQARHTLEAVNPRFAREVQPGDVVAGGRNFGCGSSRETAPEALRALGVGCVVAESFARIFLRNAVAIGLPVLICPRIRSLARDGDLLEIDLAAGRITNRATGAVAQAAPLPPVMQEILAAGGVMPLLRRLAAAAPAGSGWVDDVGS